MKKGTISELVLKRSILKHIHKDKNIIRDGAAIGNDAALLHIEGEDVSWATGFSDSRELIKLLSDKTGISVLDLAYIRACNNMYAGGGEPVAAFIKLTVGEKVKEGVVRNMMTEISERAAKDMIAIAGGDTKISAALREDAFLAEVSLLGREVYRGEKPCAGDRVIICGYAGDYGTSNLIMRHGELLRWELPESYLEDALIKNDKPLTIKEAALACFRGGAKYVHDVSNGGIYAALYQITDKAGTGIRVRHENIPIRQETIEVAERLGVNPYMLCGTGGLVAVCSREKEKEVLAELERTFGSGCPAASAGELTKEKLRCIYSEEFRINRVIDLPEGDEIYKEVQNDE